MKTEIFTNEELGQVRIIREGDTFLFCGNDVALALGYSNPRSAIHQHCKSGGVVKRDATTFRTNQYGAAFEKTESMTFITEGNVYRLITGSKLPAAEKFERWIFEEVLPCIRKYGAYITPEIRAKLSKNPRYIQELVDMLQREEERSTELQERVSMLSELNESLWDQMIEDSPKVSFYDNFIAPGRNTSLTITAKELGVSISGLVRFLTAARFLYRAPGGKLLPYQKWLSAGYFVVKDYVSACGHVGAYTLVTPTGKVFLHELLGELAEKSAS